VTHDIFPQIVASVIGCRYARWNAFHGTLLRNLAIHSAIEWFRRISSIRSAVLPCTILTTIVVDNHECHLMRQELADWPQK